MIRAATTVTVSSSGSSSYTPEYSLFTDFDAVGDGQVITDASMTSGSTTLTSPSNPFTSGDVGKTIVVGVSASSRHKSTISTYVSAGEVTLADAAPSTISSNGAVWGTDNSAALQSALTSLATIGNPTKLVIPTGKFLMAGSAAVQNFINLQNSIIIEGVGSSSQLIVATGSGVNMMTVQNIARFTMRNLVLHGTPDTLADARAAIETQGADQAIFEEVGFYGVSSLNSGGGVILGSNSIMKVQKCRFRGCTGDGANNVAVIEAASWRGLVVDETEFIDFGSLDGVLHSKTPLAGTVAWVQVSDPNDALTDAYEQSVAEVRNCRFDEGAFWGVRVRNSAPGGNLVSDVRVEGVRCNVTTLASGGGVYVQNTDRVSIARCWFGYNSVNVNRAVALAGSVNIAKLVDVKAEDSSNEIEAATGVEYLELIDCVYTTLDSSATRTDVVDKGVTTTTP